MTDISTLAFIATSVGIGLTCLLFSLFHRQGNSYLWQRATWIGMSLLLTILSACSNSATTQTKPSITPLALTRTAQQTATPTKSTDWTTYHRDNQRTGYLASTPDPHSLSKIWGIQLDGAVYAEPLVVGNDVIVATEGDSLYALDPMTGNVKWHTNVGSPVPQSSLPCGDIDPLGITGTPVYDPATGLVFAVAEVTGPAHVLIGVDVTTGQVKVRRSVDTDGMDPRAHQQRAALTLANGMVYINYGGLDGDCSDYIGRVVASRTDGQGPLLVYRVPTPREAGIWAPPGASVDAAGNLYVSVGNGAITQGQWDHSDSILKLSSTLQLKDGFAPTSWGPENDEDQDMGSQGPVLLPGNFVFAAGKSGKGYTLHANALGGIGGQIDAQDVCDSFGGAATVGSTIFIPCTNGVRQITVDTSGHMHQGWHASGDIVGSPVVGGHTVYSLSNGMIYALNMDSGHVITSLNVGSANRFATPTIFGTSIFVGTYTGITAVKIV
ncbi:MAG TPA: PQQ-binding-like beta-propeller repeat protein [Ktedonobacteraceae bacterium]